jgi:hypothetical protein
MRTGILRSPREFLRSTGLSRAGVGAVDRPRLAVCGGEPGGLPGEGAPLLSASKLMRINGSGVPAALPNVVGGLGG